MKYLYLIWLAVAFVFFSLGIFHYKQAQTPYPHFDTTVTIPDNSFIFDNAIATANQKRLDIFTNEINLYIENYNKNSKWSNMAAFVGYVISGCLAILSFFIEIATLKKKNNMIA